MASGGSLNIANQAQANGIAYKIVANAAGLAVQDATDYVRFISTISATVISISLANFAVSKNAKDLEPIEPATTAAANSIQHLTAVGTAAAEVMGDFA